MDLNLIIELGIEKQKRRSKTDLRNRDFSCGCGKSYLSYPALYTHIKTKHGGECPENTISNLISSSKKRGRPRKVTEKEKIPDKILSELQMLGGSSDSKSELVDSPLYPYILKWENYSTFTQSSLNSNDSFAMYLIDTSKLVDPHHFCQIAKFIENFKNCIEKRELKTLNKLPEELQYFIQHYIPLYTPSCNKKLSMSLALHFSQWLFEKKLSEVKLTLL